MMKRINIINKAAAVISILLCALSLAACGNAVVESAENTAQGISAKVQIKMSGAAPSRSATSSFTDTITWYITAMSSDYSADHDQIISGAMASAFSSTNTFTMDIPKAGTYSFTVLGYPGLYTKAEQLTSLTPLFQGAKESVEISKTGLASALVISVAPLLTGSQPQNADPSEATVTTAKGSINLKISDESGLISKVAASLAAFQKDMDPIKKEAAFTSGITLLNITDVPVGKYTATLKFEDSAGNIRYSCNEAINVYSGMTTDTWYGTAPYFITNAGKSSFVLNQTIINSYAAEIVPSTNYVLYNYEQGGPEVNGEKKYNYYFVNGNDLENPLSSPAVTSLAVGDSSSIIDARCFDSEGNLYLLQMSYDYQNDMALQSTKTDWTAPNMIEKLGINYGYERNLAITSDFKTNKFYIFVIDQDADTTVNVNCYPNILDSNGVTTTKISKSLEFGGGSLGSYYFVVNNDKLYMLSTSQGVSNPYTLRIYDLSLLSGNSSSMNYSKSISIDLLSILGVDAVKGEISDMLYQNECLYMLYKEVSDYDPDPDVYSRGGVIQYNLLTGSTLFKGFSSNCIAKDSGYSLQAMTRDTYGNQYLLYMDATGNEPFVPDVNKAEKYPDIYVPGENEASFYGPTKFIAIKPKQLVISDEGFTYYTNNGLLYRKNVNRVAIVNLEDFAMEFKNINPSLSMEENYTGNLLNRGSVGLEAGDVYYKKDGDNYTAFSSDCCYLCVITEEE